MYDLAKGSLIAKFKQKMLSINYLVMVNRILF